MDTPPRGVQVPLPLGAIDVFQRPPLGSTAKISVSPVVKEVLAAGPVPAIVAPTGFGARGAAVPLAWPLTAGLTVTAKSDANIRVAKAMLLIARRLRFIFSAQQRKTIFSGNVLVEDSAFYTQKKKR